jgi:hypothetical protein
MRYKYSLKNPNPKTTQTRRKRPEKWVTGSDPFRREKYYAYIKHRAQAKHRKEDYELTWDDWEALWSDELFLLRGRKRDDMCITRVNKTQPWSASNVVVVSRLEQLRSCAKTMLEKNNK